MADPAADRRPPTLVRAAAGTFGANVTAAVLGLTNVLIIARALGPIGRGDVAFVMTVVLFTSELVSLSVQEANANLGGSKADLRPGLATNSFITAIFLGALGALAVVALVSVFPAVGGEVSRPLLWLGLASIPVYLVKLYLQFLLQSDYRFAIPNVAWVAGPLTTASVNGVMAALGVLTVQSAIAVWIAGQLLGMALLVYGVARHVGFGRADIGLLRRSWSFGTKTHLGRCLSMGCYRSDQWFIGVAVGSHELGLYSVARAWADLLFYLPGVIVSLQRPDLVRASAHEAAAIATRVYRRAVFLSTGAGALLAAAAPLLCVTVFGAEFGGAVEDLRVLALAAPGIVTIELLSNAFIAQRRPLIHSIAYGIAFAVTVGLNVLLVPAHGGLGAAIATSAAYTAGGIAAAWTFTRIFASPLRELVPTAADLKWYLRKTRTMVSAGRGAS